MTITREGKFLITRTLGKCHHLGLESSKLNACIAEVLKGGYAGVFGSPVFGFHENTLDALLGLPNLKSIWFWEIALKDVEAVYGLSNLESFGVHPRRPAIDFSRLPMLKQLVIEPRPKDSGLEALSLLEMLHIWRYAPKSKTFHDLLLPPNIEELQITWANPDSLAGLPVLTSLKRLEFHRCRNLASIAELPDLFPNLEHLVVSTCGKVDTTALGNLKSRLPGLKFAFVQNARIV